MSGLLFNFSSRDDRASKRWAFWKQLAGAYGLDLMVYTAGAGPIKKPAADLIVPTIQAAQEQIEGVEWVFLIAPKRPTHPKLKQRPTLLRDFVHPAEAVYVFGPDNMELHPNGQRMDHCVRVEAPASTGELHAFPTAAIVAYDRWRKQA